MMKITRMLVKSAFAIAVITTSLPLHAVVTNVAFIAIDMAIAIELILWVYTL